MLNTEPTESRRPRIVPRTPALAFDPAAIPRLWFGGLPLPSMLANGVNLLFPAGERFFVRSVHFYESTINDPELRAQIKGFAGQEGRHARAHEDFFGIMEAQGYQIRDYLRRYTHFAYGVIEKMAPPVLRLAVTAAAEHFTAIMAENALTQNMFDHAHPVMRQLLLWHAAEEIEHKSVAFDVLKAVDPRYSVRVAGMAVAAILLGSFWFTATVMLMRQERTLPRQQPHPLVKPFTQEQVKTMAHPLSVFVRGIREYVQRGFHPSHNDNYHLATAYLTRVGMNG